MIAARETSLPWQPANFTVQPHDATGSAARSAIAFHVESLIAQVPARAARRAGTGASGARRGAPFALCGAVCSAPYISAIKPKETDDRLKWLGQQAGAVRDLDVLEKLLQKRAKKLDAVKSPRTSNRCSRRSACAVPRRRRTSPARSPRAATKSWSRGSRRRSRSLRRAMRHSVRWRRSCSRRC